MKNNSDLSLHLAGALFIVVLVAILLWQPTWGALCPVSDKVLEVAQASNCFDFWFSRYQTMIAGTAALLAAWWSVSAMQRQIKESIRLSTKADDDAFNAFKQAIAATLENLKAYWKGVEIGLNCDGSRGQVSASPISAYWGDIQGRMPMSELRVLAEASGYNRRGRCLEVLFWLDIAAKRIAAQWAERQLEPKLVLENIRTYLTHFANALDNLDSELASAFKDRSRSKVDNSSYASLMERGFERYIAKRPHSEG